MISSIRPAAWTLPTNEPEILERPAARGRTPRHFQRVKTALGGLHLHRSDGDDN